jgi:dipeptidyl aminopeptidase/acylaminoacyl peptidase
MRPIPWSHSFRIAATAAMCLFPGFAGAAAQSMTPFRADDLVRLDRVSDPQAAPDGKSVAFVVREADLSANKGHYGVWLLALDSPGAEPRRVSEPGATNYTSPRWSADGRSLYVLSNRAEGRPANSATSQVWRFAIGHARPEPVTASPVDVTSFSLSPDGRRLLASMDVYDDCRTLDCSARRLAEAGQSKRTGMLHERLFVRHWDSWSNGTRAQLFSWPLDAHGRALGEPAALSRGLDGDVPSKPFGDDGEYAFSPDGASVYFSLRVAGQTEPWSTNFDIYVVPADGSGKPLDLTAANPAWDTNPRVSPDGRTLAYRAMRRPGFEADRFGIQLRDLASGRTEELLPQWDHSADALQWSRDGSTLYALAEDLGQKRVYAIDVATRSVRPLTGDGTVNGYALAGNSVIVQLETLAGPAQLYRVPASAAGADGVGAPEQLTHANAARLAATTMGEYEQFSFKGWNDETVHGYVVKPAGYEPGRKYPVAFIIHGGPQGSMGNDFHFRWNPQTYAGIGFAVVMIDFHGSTGYGQAFTDAISQHWGDRPLEDLQKGWAYVLAKYPFLDGARACALGASYGGYMVNWMAGNWPEPWKCLVTHDGILDTRMAYYDTEELWFDEWERGGTQYEQPEAYERFNPINHVSKWRVPMLVIQGGRDFRIPESQGIGVFTALQRRGIPSQFLYFPDENHWVLKPHNSLQWHETVEAWIKRWTAAP